MKSSDEQLKGRGYIVHEDTLEYEHLNKDELLDLLNSKEAHKRTIGVRLLSNKVNLDEKMITLFCDKLSIEKKLYIKIELCDALLKKNNDCARIMVNYLGLIGKNQHKELPKKPFNKRSYPLPHDIISRTLAHMSVNVLPELMTVLKSGNVLAIREVIDAIGFLCFYNDVSEKAQILKDLMDCLHEYDNDPIIRWKIVRALESFNNEEVIDILNHIKENDEEESIRNEADRSLRIIKDKFN
ncbi:HEAT repeat domain-containing protein [Anaeromicrobium sediminis]|uniref:HEAT repeat domain-containing protein n=1 Tax=Anaeromicrobium sediminis TaxID=1478221 RepID=A0A267MP86_9FIRM|nr:hypothetical protein [Anaeromicrobium sediminis]PAB60540.1 hypothetical protein CCE28_03075 [Anaeromicrobium sediminis]